jgi:hypothetical protein
MTWRALVFIAVASCAGAEAIVALVRAGRLEAKGRLDESRAGTRGGGLRLAACSVVGAGAALVSGVWIASGLLLAAGVAALLTGLSRKPRPSGWTAALLFVAGALAALLGAFPRG